MEETRLNTDDKKCSCCGGNLVFCPEQNALKCQKCESLVPVQKIERVETHDIANSFDQTDDYKKYVKENKIFKCPNCGSSVVLNIYEISKNCPYCGTSLVAEENMLPGIKPDGIIPFAFGKEQTGQIFAKEIKKEWFAPRKFKKMAMSDAVKGIYVPSFCFGAKTNSVYVGSLYNEYTTTDKNGHTTTHRQSFAVSGKYARVFDDILVESSSKIEQEQLLPIEPYDFSKKVGYQDAYLRGYSAEHYSQSVKECTETYKSLAKEILRSEILRKYHYDGVNYLNIKTDFSDETFSYYFVPIYRFDYQYKNKHYVTYMNGQTGKIDKHIPKSKFKIILVVLLVLLLVALPFIIGIVSGASAEQETDANFRLLDLI